MAEFVAGNDPADHTVSEVNEFLRNGDPTADEYERVINAEREGKGRVGIISGSGAESEPFQPGSEAAGPNERATGQESPADQAKTVDDPNASGDAGVTAEPYPDSAPSALGPEQPQSVAEQAAHDATVAAQDAAAVADLSVPTEDAPARGATQTPAEALQQAITRTSGYRRPTGDEATQSGDNQ